VPDDPLGQVLRLVAEGRLTADEAAPILDALDARQRAAADDPATPAAGPDRRGTPRYARIEVVERGRKAVDLRIPLSLGRRAIGSIPGLSSAQVVELTDAVNRGLTGPIVDISDEDGDGVRIVLE
jgi:hypothetical protein